jgi:curli biogenesis system outer membrane secretion channel CsgG
MAGNSPLEEMMNRSLVASLCAILAAGCGTTTEEKTTRDSMPEIGNYGPPPAGMTPVRAAVMEFQDKTGQRIGEQGGEQFETLVHRSKRFNLVDRMQMKTLLKEQGLEGIVDPAELAKPGKIRGVGYMFLGTITNYRVMTNTTKTDGGILDSALGRVAPLSIDTSKTVINVEVGVDIKLVNTTTGEIVAKDFGEVKNSLSASAWGVRVLGIGGDAKNNVRLDKDSHGKILRWALDESYKKMIPDIDDKLSKPAANVCPKCRTEIAANDKFCAKCGTSSEAAKCSCGEKLLPDAKFCGKCGKPAPK